MRNRRVAWATTLVVVGAALCIVRIPIGHIDGPTSDLVVTLDTWPLGAILAAIGGVMLIDGLRRRRPE